MMASKTDWRFIIRGRGSEITVKMRLTFSVKKAVLLIVFLLMLTIILLALVHPGVLTLNELFTLLVDSIRVIIRLSND